MILLLLLAATFAFMGALLVQLYAGTGGAQLAAFLRFVCGALLFSALGTLAVRTVVWALNF